MRYSHDQLFSDIWWICQSIL